MALSIKNDVTEQLARKIANATGESITEAIQRSLQERWARLTEDRRRATLTRQLEEILQRVDNMPTLDSRSADEILGYDEHGLPR
ncbi:MAG: type II toxin-antitoxin system VapB family antitoxin [Acidobacteriaceae bacterium]|nr:type II toxin-antitoxin system VapB family antitoxin [Acidobacteriaceae bacterium]